MKAWDLSETGNAEWANIPTVGQFGDVGFLADGRLVASGVDGDVRIHDLETGDVSPQIGPRVKEHSFALSPDGTAVAIASPTARHLPRGGACLGPGVG